MRISPEERVGGSNLRWSMDGWPDAPINPGTRRASRKPGAGAKAARQEVEMNRGTLHTALRASHLIYAMVAGALAVAAFLAIPPGPALAASTITVDSTADGNTADGVLTLREAILLANGGVGGDGVTSGLGRGLEFEEYDNLGGSIPGAGSVDTINFSDPPFSLANTGVISVSTVLPTLVGGNDVIDATGRGVRIDGTGNPSAFNCLTIDSAFNTVKGLHLTDCAYGIYIVVDGAANTIGPGNTLNHNTNGIGVGGHQNTIKGNKIGTTIDGVSTDSTTANNTGISISGVNNVVGGSAPADRNIVSGNSTGIDLQIGATGNTVKGNYVGTDVTGTLDRGNSGVGVTIRDDSNTIGGTGISEGNVISGNGDDGIWITGVAATGNTVQGNYIGTNAAGTASIQNYQGVEIQSGTGNHVGGTIATARNVISGNANSGVRVAGSGNFIEGNLIGTTAAGTAPLGNGNQGIRVENASNTIIDRNVVAANADVGIRTAGTSPGTILKGNHIGTDYGGAIDLGNAVHGVYLDSSLTTVGGATDSHGNVIAFNGGDGIYITGPTGAVIARNSVHDNVGAGVHVAAGTAHRVSRNMTLGNGGLGVDLAGGAEDTFNVTANDASPDGDTGPNNLQNFPTVGLFDLDTVSNVQGTLDSAPSTLYTLQFFYGAGCDGSLHGEAPNFLFEANVSTDGAGHAAFTLFFSTPPEFFTPTQYVSATATDPAGSTSELSRCKAVFPGVDDDSDGILDAVDNCPDWPNPAQLLPAWSVPTNDSDCDGFSAAAEAYMGTAPAAHCNNTTAVNDEVDVWPSDFNDSRLTSLADVVLMGSVYNQPAGADPAKKRFDLNQSGTVSLADVVMIGPFYNKGCS
jgi:CSLREA domain-containing protein